MRLKNIFPSDGFKNVVFDCDSTLTYVEGADELAKLKGLGREVSKITHQGMNGEITFAQSLYQRLSLLRPSKKDIEHIYQLYRENLVEDVEELVEALRFLKKEVFIITGGYQLAVERLGKFLRIGKSNIFGVRLKFGKNEDFVGVQKGHLTANGGKAKMVSKISKTGPTVLVGDGVTDLEAKESVDLFVGFGGVIERDVVKRNSEVYVKARSLAFILPLVCNREESIKIKKSKFKNLYLKGYNTLIRLTAER